MAFDRVNHHLLLRKLASIGFTNNVVAFMDSYLSMIAYPVRVGKEYSEKYYATSAVPQGSNTAPLLFLVFINDLPGCITGSQCLLFADDFKILKEVSSQADTIALQQDLDFVISWFKRYSTIIFRDGFLALFKYRYRYFHSFVVVFLFVGCLPRILTFCLLSRRVLGFFYF